jgi:hypothetical protein
LDTVGVNSQTPIKKGDDVEVAKGSYVKASTNEVVISAPKPKSMGARVEGMIASAWNSPFTRAYIPDVITIGAGFNGIVGVGAGTSMELNWILRGPQSSIKPILTTTQTVGGGYSVDATINVGGSTYLGPVSEIQRGMVETSIKDGYATGVVSGGVAALGKLGGTVTYTPTAKGYGIVSFSVNVGAGLPAGELPVNASGGLSNTWILHDFNK